MDVMIKKIQIDYDSRRDPCSSVIFQAVFSNASMQEIC